MDDPVVLCTIRTQMFSFSMPLYTIGKWMAREETIEKTTCSICNLVKNPLQKVFYENQQYKCGFWGSLHLWFQSNSTRKRGGKKGLRMQEKRGPKEPEKGGKKSVSLTKGFSWYMGFTWTGTGPIMSSDDVGIRFSCHSDMTRLWKGGICPADLFL